MAVFLPSSFLLPPLLVSPPPLIQPQGGGLCGCISYSVLFLPVLVTGMHPSNLRSQLNLETEIFLEPSLPIAAGMLCPSQTHCGASKPLIPCSFLSWFTHTEGDTCKCVHTHTCHTRDRERETSALSHQGHYQHTYAYVPGHSHCPAPPQKIHLRTSALNSSQAA